MAHPALNTFIIYARDDKEYKNQLLRHLRPLVSSGYLKVWHDGDILPGEDWEKQIKINLKASQLVLVLVSVNCLNSEFIETKELQAAMAQLRAGHTRVVPIIVAPCGWRYHPLLVGLQGLPEDMKPVSDWPNPDRAWANVVDAVAQMVADIRETQAKAEAQRAQEAEVEAQKAKETERRRQEKEDARREQEAQVRRETEEGQRLADQQANAERRAHEQREQEAALSAEARRAEKDKAAEAQRLQEAERQKQEETARREREARQLAETLAWQSAIAANTADGFDAFAAQHPDSAQVREALLFAKQLRRAAQSPKPWGRYAGVGTGALLLILLMLKLFGGGAKPDSNVDSRRPLPAEQNELPHPSPEETSWQTAKGYDNIPAYREFVEQYPNSDHAPAARSVLSSMEKQLNDYLQDAELLLKNGLKNDARQVLQKALKLNPSDLKANQLLQKL